MCYIFLSLFSVMNAQDGICFFLHRVELELVKKAKSGNELPGQSSCSNGQNGGFTQYSPL